MNQFITIGAILGLSAGCTPGPLLTLVISETLQRNVHAGIKVALSPIITDLPIILFTVFLLSRLADFQNVLGIITLTGGLFVLFLGYERLRTTSAAFHCEKTGLNPLSKGMLANALSPHPYLFWLSVGAPVTTKAIGHSLLAPLAFIISFYTVMVGSKIVLALIVGKSRSFLDGKAYLYAMRFLGLTLCILAIILFRDGIALLGLM